MTRMLRPAEVAAIFGVNVETVGRWARAGKIPFVLTRGGHRRYPEDQIRELAKTQGEVESTS